MFILIPVGEGNGIPLQYSCLENPMDGGAWKAAVHPWSRLESDMTEQLPFHFSLSCIGEGNGNPLQCSCLENSRDGGAWWAAVYGVTQSRTQLKRLSSSSSIDTCNSSPTTQIYHIPPFPYCNCLLLSVRNLAPITFNMLICSALELIDFEMLSYHWIKQTNDLEFITSIRFYLPLV